MSAITNIWRQLVQRRLWPLAILLIAALAAVPLALAKDPDAAAPVADATAAQADGESALAVEPIVAQATAADRAKRRKVLGKSKNPFGVEEEETPGSAAAPNSNGSTSAQDPTAPAPSSGGGTPSIPSFPSFGGSAPAPSTPVDAGPAPKRYSKHELTVRFGTDDSMERMDVKRLEALPLGEEEPLVVYLGVADRGKTAVFLIDSSIKAEGDGKCMPDPNTCEEIHMRAGETEFFDVVDEKGESVGAYQLDLLEIHGGSKSSPARTARASKAHAASPGALQYERVEETGELRTVASGVARTAAVGLPLP